MILWEHSATEIASWIQCIVEQSEFITRNTKYRLPSLSKEVEQFVGASVRASSSHSISACLAFAPLAIGLHHNKFLRELRSRMKCNKSAYDYLLSVQSCNSDLATVVPCTELANHAVLTGCETYSVSDVFYVPDMELLALENERQTYVAIAAPKVLIAIRRIVSNSSCSVTTCVKPTYSNWLRLALCIS